MARKATRQKRIDATPPTPEQEQLGEYRLEPITERGQLVGTAYRKRPMIDILHERGIFTDGQHRALKHYRHHADLADKSPIRDSLTNWMPKASNGHGPGVELLNAVRVTQACERAAGALVDILRAVVVDDVSLSRWAMLKDGATERCRTRGALTVRTMEPSEYALKMARVEIQMAACRVQGELEA
jgi:hypothetical protein